ncbi:MAG: hypothetical protein NT168_03055 [Planctomycetota bacterium]|nr:hypothetical protein [Planctomycetota bacterium]
MGTDDELIPAAFLLATHRDQAVDLPVLRVPIVVQGALASRSLSVGMSRLDVCGSGVLWADQPQGPGKRLDRRIAIRRSRRLRYGSKDGCPGDWIGTPW